MTQPDRYLHLSGSWPCAPSSQTAPALRIHSQKSKAILIMLTAADAGKWHIS
jgi:hypothetical protein